MAFNSVLSITRLHDTGLWVENKDKISNEKMKKKLDQKQKEENVVFMDITGLLSLDLLLRLRQAPPQIQPAVSL